MPAAVTCKILLAAVPTSTDKVPTPVIVFAAIPVPEYTEVTVPPEVETGSQSVFVEFQPST